MASDPTSVRRRWVAELAKEQAVVEDQLLELRSTVRALKEQLKGFEGAPVNSRRRKPSRKGDPQGVDAGWSSDGSDMSMVGLVPATTEDVAIALQMLEFLRQQKRQLKKRARQIKEAQQICRAGANASGRVFPGSGYDVPEPYIQPGSSGRSSGLEQAMLQAMELQTRGQADSMASLWQALELMGLIGDQQQPRNCRDLSTPEPSGIREQSYDSRIKQLGGGGARIQAGPTTRQHQPGRTMSIASLVAPPWQHEPVPATAPELGRHRRESLRSTRQWAELQRQQQRLIACHSDWMRSFRQRMAFAARGCKLGGISAAGVPMVADTALSFGAPQVHKLEVHPDKDGTGAVLMLNGGVELRIMVKSK